MSHPEQSRPTGAAPGHERPGGYDEDPRQDAGAQGGVRQWNDRQAAAGHAGAGQDVHGQQPGGQYAEQPGVNQVGGQPGGQYGGQYAEQPGVNQYGRQPGVDQYGGRPGGQYAEQPGVNQYGGQPGVDQYGGQPGVDQYGGQPGGGQGEQYGQQVGQAPPQQYGGDPGRPGQAPEHGGELGAYPGPPDHGRGAPGEPAGTAGDQRGGRPGAAGDGVRDAGDARQPAEHGTIFDSEHAARWRTQWEDVRMAFVDRPRDAVAQADALVGEVLEELSRTFSQQRGALDPTALGGDPSTEELRRAVQRYREFFDRLLTL